ncbi:FAD/NAD-P-binding domain-containing protein [Mycena crocata]|nr:FAD/NAD-P-binding domain-containing protein [Mycena crocata]
MFSTSEPKAVIKNFRVAIVGGGLCGLACAVGLTRFGIKADVFEAAPKFDEVGAGVHLGPNALCALKGLGILDIILPLIDDTERVNRRMRYVSGYGEHKWLYDYNDGLSELTTDPGIGIYRPTFIDALSPLLDPTATHFNKRCTSITTSPSGVNCIHFSDGTTHEADLVIGADGIKSISRTAVVGVENKVLQFTNTVAYRGLVPLEMLIKDGMKIDLGNGVTNFVGIDKHLIVFPIKSRKIINIVAFATDNSVPIGSRDVTGPWVESVPQQQLLDVYEGWGQDVMVMLNHLKNPSKWFIHALTPLETFTRGKIVLAGDAAHAMTPHLGAGVGQGFEDVFILCQLLGHPSTNLSNLEAVLQAYDAVRRPHANMVMERSFRAGIIYEGGYGLDDIGKHLTGIREPIWHHDLDQDVASAIASLQKEGPFPVEPQAK